MSNATSTTRRSRPARTARAIASASAGGAFLATWVYACLALAQALPSNTKASAATAKPTAASPAKAARAQPAAPVQPAATVPAEPESTSAVDAAPAQATVLASTAQITFTTMPPTEATVTWGKKLLGRITPRAALVIVRPRDSGPLDVIVQARGFLPVHTRAHTFADTRVSVKLTRPTEVSTLLGYRQPLVPDKGEPAPYDPNLSPVWNPNPGWDMTAPQSVSPLSPMLSPTATPAPASSPGPLAP